MIKESLFIAGSLLLLSAPFSRAQDGGLRPGWRMLSGTVPAGLFKPIYSATMDESVKPLRGVSAQHGQYDIREWLKGLGIDLPTDSIAIYQKNTQNVVVIGPKEAVELVEIAFPFPGVMPKWPSIHVTATLAEFSTSSFPKVRNLPYARLRAVAGKTWTEIEEISLTGKNGQRAVSSKRSNSNSQAEAWDGAEKPPLAPGEEGTVLEVEPVVGPDLETIDLNYHWSRKSGKGAEAECLDAMSNLTTRNEAPRIVAIWPAARAGARHRALVLRVSLVNSEGTLQSEIDTETLREIRKLIKASTKRDPK